MSGKAMKAGFEIPATTVGATAGRGRVYEVTLGSRDRTANPSVVKVIDLDAPELRANVADLAVEFGIGNEPDMEDDALIVERVAKKSAAVDLVDYEAFDSDSRYLEAFDRVMEDFYVSDMHRAGTRVPYRMMLAYGDAQEGEWGDTVMATNDEDATFQARWICAENCGARPKDGLEGMIGSMDARVIDCFHRPVTAEQLAKGIMELGTAFLRGGDVEAEIRKLVAVAAPCTDARPVGPN